MNREQIQAALAAAIAERAREGDRLGRTKVNAITDVVKRHWFDLVKLIRTGGQYAAVKSQAATILQRMAANTEAGIEPLLMGSATWGFDSAFEVWADHLPAAWWRVALVHRPEIALLESVEFNFPEPGGPGPSGRGADGKRLATEVLTGGPSRKKIKKKKGKFPAKKPKKAPKKVPAAVVAKVKKYTRPDRSGLLRIVRSRGWKSRMKKWTKKITNFDKVAERIARGIEQGKTIEQITNEVKPFVHNFAASARRLVRTEAARIENQMMEETFETFSSIIDGFQIINPLDERTRPTHAIRAGRIFWNDKRKKPHASERPELPDEANCRCCYAPILNAPAPEELAKGPRPDPRTYSGFFNTLSDDEKAKLVGKARWSEMKKKTKRPSWFDAVDPKTGRLIDLDKLKKERPSSTLSRRKKQKGRLGRDIKAAKRSLKYWPPETPD